jgi:hypothetical protein
VTPTEREGSEVEALLTDRYLERVLARATADPTSGPVDSLLDPVLREVAERLRRDLVRVHPSFRFEERLASRLAEAAAALQIPAAAGAEGGIVVPIGAVGGSGLLDHDDAYLFDDEMDLDRRELSRPLLIGGALTSAAISLAGAAWVAWRRARPTRGMSPMVRAARAVRDAHSAALRGPKRSSSGRGAAWPRHPSARGFD